MRTLKKSSLILLSVLFCLNTFSQNYNKIENTLEVCEIQSALNEMLLEKYNNDTYSKTGIITYGFYNNVVVMFFTGNKFINIEELSKNANEKLKTLDIDFSKIRYLIFAESKCNACQGDVIGLTGDNLAENINNYEVLSEQAIIQRYNWSYDNDPDFKKIIKDAYFILNYDKNWGGGTRKSRYEKQNENCIEKHEKAQKKKNK